jgi:protein-disulfide isomerase
MTEPLPPDAGALPAADSTAPEPPPSDAVPDEPSAAPTEGPLDAAADGPSVDFAAAEPAEPADAPSPAPRTGRGPAVLVGYLAAALAGALLLAGSLVAFGGLGRATPSPSPTPTPAPNEANGPSLGSAAAPVTVEIWADYQCPYCRLETMVFGGSLERAFVLPGTVRVVFRDFAFLGQESTDAAVAARCAGRQDPGAYWRYHDLLFAAQQGENQGTFSRANLVTIAGIAALDATSFTACLDDPSVAKAVAAETAAGKALGVESTPTMRVTGPGGTKTLAGFSSGWSTIRDAIAAVAVPAPSAGASPGGSASPGAGASPGGSASPSPTGTPTATSTPTPTK